MDKDEDWKDFRAMARKKEPVTLPKGLVEGIIEQLTREIELIVRLKERI